MADRNTSIAGNSSASPLVSVIITAFNREDLLARAVASARAQNYAPIEIVVVDDASTDNTPAVIASLAGPDLKPVRNPKNRGIAGAKNAGIDASSGEFVAFLDSDDEWMPGKLRAQVDAITQPNAPPLAFTAFYVTRLSGHDVIRIPYRRTTWRDSSLSGISVSLGSTLLARRSLFDEIGPLNESIRRMEDRDWILRYLDVHPEFLVAREPLARIHNSGFPTSKTVREGAAALIEANQARLLRWGQSKLDLFRASLQFEIAVAYYREGNKLRSIVEAVRALAISPSLALTIFDRFKMKLRDADSA